MIGGFSQGAAVACAVALGMGRPRAAGLLMMSGFYPDGPRLEDGPAVRSAGMPAYVTHGAYDPIIPVGFGRKARDLLEEGGLDVTYREPRVAALDRLRPDPGDPRLGRLGDHRRSR